MKHLQLLRNFYFPRFYSPRFYSACFFISLSSMSAMAAENIALHDAVRIGQIEVVERLVEEEAVDINIKNDYGWTALHIAAQLESTEMLEKLVDLGADIHATDSMSRTALHFAVSRKMIEKLVKLGADIHAKDSMLGSIRDYAVWREDTETIKWIESLEEEEQSSCLGFFKLGSSVLGG